tara:strand:+ start:7998 stop:8789 length:792 start_codon:yes stop_codon:yes gene_type:complete
VVKKQKKEKIEKIEKINLKNYKNKYINITRNYIYMSLFVHKENQTLLWKIVNNNKTIVSFFQQIQDQDKYNWFQNIISMFYEKYKFKNIEIQELSSINKEVLQYMVQDATFYLQPPQTQPNEEPLEYKRQSKQDAYMSDFNQRQQIYEQMNKKDVPDTIDFSEKDDTLNNSNMEEMLEKQKKARDLDLQPFPSENLRPLVKLENEIVTIKNDVEDISTLYENNTINYEKFCMQQEEMQEYKNTIKDLQKEVEEIKKLLKQESN